MASEKQHLLKRFEEFANRTALFSQVGDFHPGQVVWVPEQDRWVLLDFAGKFNGNLGNCCFTC
jgi:predicted trehalose synthase